MESQISMVPLSEWNRRQSILAPELEEWLYILMGRINPVDVYQDRYGKPYNPKYVKDWIHG